MSNPEQPGINPYESIHSSTSQLAQPPIRETVRVCFGGKADAECQVSFDGKSLTLKFLDHSFCIASQAIQELRSGGDKWNRFVQIEHCDSMVPTPVQFMPWQPAQWYDCFESMDIPTRDDANVRDTTQVIRRVMFWMDNGESLFWMAWILMIVVGGPMLGLISYLMYR